MPDDTQWIPYGQSRKDVSNLNIHRFTQAQADALAEQCAELKPSQMIMVQQTWTKKGGRHTYAKLPNGEEMHISREGKVASLGAIN